MDIKEAFICVNCNEIFNKNRQDKGEYGYLIERYRQLCPSCGSEVAMPLSNLIKPLPKKNLVRLVNA